jgi:anion-transporting  ArsA/GET3 family ATPase
VTRHPLDFTALVADHRIVVCVGSGGVGKTTVSAALALWGALHGRRTAVLTIDPARRLATCLGLKGTQEQERQLSLKDFAAYGLSPHGTLTALLVDQQSAWDAVVERYVPLPEMRKRLLANRFYLGLSRTFAGAHEYMALDTLATLVQRDIYDLIVVDTPPAKQALDFLEAPQRVQRFLDSQVSKWFIQPSISTSWAAFSAVNRTTTFLLRKIEAATGIAALGDISEFFTVMQRMFSDFGHRLTHMNELLSSRESAFVLVTRTEEEVLAEAEEFLLNLHRLKVPLKGVIVNGTYGPRERDAVWSGDAQALGKRLQKILQIRSGKHELLQSLVENFLAYHTLVRGEKRRLERFRSILPQGSAYIDIPTFPAFPADLSGLLKMHQYLFVTTQSRFPSHRSGIKKKGVRKGSNKHLGGTENRLLFCDGNQVIG